MEWNIFYDEPNVLIKVTVEGKIYAQRTAEMAIQGIKLAREKNCNKFLEIDGALNWLLTKNT